MNFLQIVQAMHREAGIPGAPPAGVQGNVGAHADLVAWGAQAWDDIQRDRQWKWMLAEFYFDTIAGQSIYGRTDVRDADTNAAPTRWRSWYLLNRLPPTVYSLEDGPASERPMEVDEFTRFARRFGRHDQAHAAGYPSVITVDVRDRLRIAPTPNEVGYRISGYYFRSNQTLSQDSHEPEMPADYHMMIVYLGLAKYGYTLLKPEVLERVQADGQRAWEALCNNQGLEKQLLRVAGPLA